MTPDTNPMMDRRTLLTGAAALTAAGTLHPNASHAQAVPNSVGTAQPKLKAPANACDCHHHIYDPGRFSYALNAGRNSPSNGTAVDYRLLQKRIGTTRSVVVQPRNYAVDNAVTLDAIARLGPNNTRGVAVLHPTVTDAELKKLNDGGVRGIRFTLGDPATDPNNSTNGIWTASPNSSFGQPGAIVPKFGARSFQFSTRFSF